MSEIVLFKKTHNCMFDSWECQDPGKHDTGCVPCIVALFGTAFGGNLNKMCQCRCLENKTSGTKDHTGNRHHVCGLVGDSNLQVCKIQKPSF